MLDAVQPYQQKTDYTCSAACLLAVARHYGVVLDEPNLTRLIGALPEIGATCEQVVEAARHLWMPAAAPHFASLTATMPYLARGVPIIANVTSFTRPGSGHFVVLIAIDDRGVDLMDPNVTGNRRCLTYQEMDRRWQVRSQRQGVVVLAPPAPTILR